MSLETSEPSPIHISATKSLFQLTVGLPRHVQPRSSRDIKRLDAHPLQVIQRTRVHQPLGVSTVTKLRLGEVPFELSLEEIVVVGFSVVPFVQEEGVTRKSLADGEEVSMRRWDPNIGEEGRRDDSLANYRDSEYSCYAGSWCIRGQFSRLCRKQKKYAQTQSIPRHRLGSSRNFGIARLACDTHSDSCSCSTDREFRCR